MDRLIDKFVDYNQYKTAELDISEDEDIYFKSSEKLYNVFHREIYFGPNIRLSIDNVVRTDFVNLKFASII